MPLSSGPGVAGEERTRCRAPFGVWAFPPLFLATKSRRASPNQLRPLGRGSLESGAPALPRPPRPPPERKKREEQRGPERALSLGPARNRPWKRSSLSPDEPTWARVESCSPGNDWAPRAPDSGSPPPTGPALPPQQLSGPKDAAQGYGSGKSPGFQMCQGRLRRLTSPAGTPPPTPNFKLYL